jgi:ATP-dependent exoDNAse (exonuclease V) alpha subunit
MTNNNLEWLIGASVGIGRTKKEAAHALMEVKANKPFPEEVIDLYQNDNYIEKLIKQYQGQTLEDEPNQEVIDKVIRTKERLNKVKDEYSKEIFLEQLKDDCFDPKTGVLTPFGYHLSKREEGEDKFYMLLDCNDMHYWNDAHGYEEVDERLKTIGASLNCNV